MSDPGTQRRKQTQQRDLVVEKALRNRDETREKLLEQGRELARRRARNVEQSRERGDSKSDSTVPAMDTNEEAAARHSHSTVPARPRGSTVPAADRLYGRRLYHRLQAESDGTPVSTQEPDGSDGSPSVRAATTDGATTAEGDSDE